MISTQMRHYVEGFDEIVREGDTDMALSGLRTASVIRVGRVAVVESGVLLGAIGEIAPERLRRIAAKLSEWLQQV